MENRVTSWVLDGETAFRQGEGILLGLRDLLQIVIGEMHALVAECRKELRGYRLVLYLKPRNGNPDTFAIYWGYFEAPPKGTLTKDRKIVKRWIRHLSGGLNHQRIYELAEVKLEPLILDLDRRAKALNDAYHTLTEAIDSVIKTLESRRERRSWECPDPDVATPEVARHLPPRYQSALGALSALLLRMGQMQSAAVALAAAYQADPLHPDLRLRVEFDKAHPCGRARWLHYGKPLACLEKGGCQDNLTDQWMRGVGIPHSTRRLLWGVEKDRRRLMRRLRRYAEVLRRIRKRAADATRRAQVFLSLARHTGAGLSQAASGKETA